MCLHTAQGYLQLNTRGCLQGIQAYITAQADTGKLTANNITLNHNGDANGIAVVLGTCGRTRKYAIRIVNVHVYQA